VAFSAQRGSEENIYWQAEDGSGVPATPKYLTPGYTPSIPMTENRYGQLKLFGGVLAVLYHLEVIDSWSRLQKVSSSKRTNSAEVDST